MCSTSSPASVGNVQAAAVGVERLPESIVATTHPETRAPELEWSYCGEGAPIGLQELRLLLPRASCSLWVMLARPKSALRN